MLRLASFILFLLAAGQSLACSNVEPGGAAERALYLFEHKDFRGLEKLIVQYQHGAAEDKDGLGVIFALYDNVVGNAPACGGPPVTAEAAKAKKQLLDAWGKALPRSAIQRTALGAFYKNAAWRARGTGYASTVGPAQFASFSDGMALARSTLERVPPQQRDPAWYEAMLSIGLATHADRGAQMALFMDAMAHNPNHWELYHSTAQYLQPQWYGSAGDYFEFAAKAAAITGSDTIYARLHIWYDRASIYTDGRTDWPRMKSGLAKLARDYPNRLNLNRYAAQACKADDVPALREAFAMVGDNTDEPRVWWPGFHLPKCRARQFGEVKCGRDDTGPMYCGNLDKDGQVINRITTPD